MNTIRRAFWAHLFTAAGALALGYALEGQWAAAVVFAVLGVLWLASAARGSTGMSGLLLYVYALALAVGLWLGIPAALALLAITAGVGAWDLNHFLQRLRTAEQVDYATGIGRAHLQRLLMVEGAGFGVGLVAVSARLGLPFWWEVLLVALVITGISSLIEFVRKQVAG